MMKVGVIGCGNIADIYFKNSKQFFNNFEIDACADINEEASKIFAKKYNVRQLSVEDILADKEIEFIINLTTPNVHYEVSKSIIESNKHSYSEKPLSIEFDDGKKLNDLAEENNVYVGCAPDTFLGAGIQTARNLLDDNAIGNVQLGSISMAVPGHEMWHPNPDFYYKYGGGPILDMGPYYFTALVSLLGSVVNVDSKIKSVYEKRVIGSGNRKGQEIKVDIPTSIISHLEFKSGALIDTFFSFDIWKHNKSHIELYGDKGSLSVPDPNMFGGELLKCASKGGEWESIPTTHMNLGKYNIEKNHERVNEDPTVANYRGIGVSEMIDSIKKGKKNRCSGELSLHVLDIMDSILESGKSRKKVNLRSECEKPEYFSEEENKKLLKG
ncbi:MAG: Gfo/Idh/MocA family oxidoreductase [Pelagibacteraceae bacterium]|nr:Gfo/Idh/MocA family oxidoreductase [Pelagibacteraceae bacterium]MBT6354587.1 Gfo/Idh/MocA family oxidoreductase [Pelagibacteraceae bacterium]